MKTIRLEPGCVRCILEKQLDKYPADAAPQEQLAYMQAVLKVLADADQTMGAPVIVRAINTVQKRMFGMERDFSEIKAHYNDIMLSQADEIAARLEAAEDPLKLGLQYAMTGNYIDFGAVRSVSEDKLKELLDAAVSQPVDEREYRALREDLLHAGKVVYILDNCGEIVLDKLLMQVIRRLNPRAEVTALVRGMPVVNDATMEDARQVGLEHVAVVIGNGNDIGGTCLEELSDEALAVVRGADVILAKGQGNFETLTGCGLNVYYVFLCKCAAFAQRFAVPVYTGILINEREIEHPDE